jgi:DNA-directed RNA polymerase omega subunit
LKTSAEIDSKFRFVIVAAKRAKQLIRGSKPRIKSKSKNPIRIAQLEVTKGLVNYDIIEPKKEQVRTTEEEGFIGEKIRDKGEEPIKKDKGKAKKKVAKPKAKPKDKAKAKPEDKPKAKPKDKAKAKPKDKPKAKPEDKAKEKPKKKKKGDKT